jgi:apolipoprotein N-acyltransferase
MKRFALTYIPLLASGIMLAWSFPTFSLHWLAWVALVPLLLRTANYAPKTAALHFFLCGYVFHTLLLQWLWANIFWGGGWAILGQQGLCLILSFFWGLLGFFWAAAHRKTARFGGALCLAGLWIAMELIHARAFTGFGWSALGYSQGANLWVAQWASIGGVSLVSFLIILVNGLLAMAIVHQESRWKRLAAIPSVLALVHVGGYLLLDDADYESKKLQAGVIQPNFPQEMKWDPAYDYEMLQRTAQMSRVLASHSPVDLLVWPEALIVRHFENPVFMEVLAGTAVDTGSHIFTGASRDEYATGKNYNSSALVSPQGQLEGYYDKVRLAAFGEYIPFENYFPFLSQIAFGGVSAGEKQVILKIGERTMGPLICFEVLFAPMAERLRQMGADMLVVVTNLAWFGGSNAIAQELEIARMRAIETRLPLIHSANTGISGVFDPYGRFHVVNAVVSPKDELVDYGDKVKPGHVIMRRFAGDFPVAAPGTRFVYMGPVLFPWLAAMAGMLLVFISFVNHLEVSLIELAPKPPKRSPPKNTPPKHVSSENAPPKAPRKSKASKQPVVKPPAQAELPLDASSKDND